MARRLLPFIAIIAICSCAFAQQIEQDLPKILLIGDSISQGYTKFVQEEMKGEADVSRIPMNGQHTGVGLEKLDEWLGETKWDVIHFNWGLHDLVYRHPDAKVYGNRDKFKGTLTNTPREYEANLEILVQRLKKTGAALVWASTTPIPPGEAGRFVGDEVRYNAVARQVMHRHSVMINDLHAAAMKFDPDAFSKLGDVHYKTEGYQSLAKTVAENIRAALTKRDNRPNIVLILVDDMGYTDVGAYGSKYYETPNVDLLAAGGTKFTQGYAACAVCSPSRYSILTGKNPTRSGITDWIRPLAGVEWTEKSILSRPEYQGGKDRPLLTPTNPRWMNREELTIAELLKTKGYATGFVGKWHLGPEGFWPEDQGFDFNAGGNSFGQPPHYFDPYPAEHQIVTFPNLEPRREGEYLTDREADEAVGFIDNNHDKPFFLMLAHYAVHAPIQAKKELIEKYEGKPVTNQIVPKYAAMVESVDDALGSVVRALKKNGLYENTLIVFTSDNGGAVHFPATDNAPLRKGKGFPYEGGIREPFIFHWPSKIQSGQVSDEVISSVDLFATFAKVAGAVAPSDIDGLDLSSVLLDGSKLKRDTMVWHFPHYWWGTNVQPYSVIRQGDMKLIYRYQQDSYELYDLANDLSETKDLAQSKPLEVERLKRLLDKTLKEQGAKLPKPNPNYELKNRPKPVTEVGSYRKL